MKKSLIYLTFLCTFMLTGNLAQARPAEQNRQIPYPPGYQTTQAGASAAQNLGDHNKSPYFQHPDFYNLKNTNTLTILERFQTYQQTTEWSCGNAAALMVLNHFGATHYQELELARFMGTNPLPEDGRLEENVLYGTTTAGMVKFFQSIGYKVESSLDDTVTLDDPLALQTWVIENLRSNRPIMVDWLDWSGHWQVIIGYETMGTETLYDDVIIFADPYDVGDHLQDGYYIYPALRFYYMWQDFQYQPAGRQVRQWLIATPHS